MPNSSPSAFMPASDATWQQLPVRGVWLFVFSRVLLFLFLGLLLGIAVFILLSAAEKISFGVLLDLSTRLLISGAITVTLSVFGCWVGFRQHRRIFWRLDTQGLSVRSGRWWQQETYVPISRVQHLDVRRGPLDRMLNLANLVVHTAGTRMAVVTVPLLDGADAEQLRAHLSQQLYEEGDGL